MINENFEYFPSLLEIKTGIMIAFHQNLENKMMKQPNSTFKEKEKQLLKLK